MTAIQFMQRKKAGKSD